MAEESRWLLEPEEMAQAKTKTSFAKYPWNEYGITAAEISIRNSTAKKIAERLDLLFDMQAESLECCLAIRKSIDEILKEIEES